MLRTNTLLLSFIESLYEKQTESNIVCRKFAKGELNSRGSRGTPKIALFQYGRSYVRRTGLLFPGFFL